MSSKSSKTSKKSNSPQKKSNNSSKQPPLDTNDEKDPFYEQLQSKGVVTSAILKGFWRDSTVPYEIEKSDNKLAVQKELEDLINKAVKEFNDKTPVTWRPKTDKDEDYVLFQQKEDYVYSQGPCLFEGKQLIQLSYPKVYPSPAPMTKVGVMHEMMHTLGFLHEHQRPDAEKHHDIGIQKPWDPDFQKAGMNFGHYDYLSIMHYPTCFFSLNRETSAEMEKCIGSLESFSRGDLSGLRRLYSVDKYAHYGQWHRPCSEDTCSDQVCNCQACGKVDNGAVWCGFEGKRNSNGHWTCCFGEDQKSKECHNNNNNHTGFWHMSCLDSCTPTNCVCESCGAGCAHIGKNAHWSCCNGEDKNASCTAENAFYSNEVKKFLDDIGLSQYYEMFRKNDIFNMSDLKQVNKDKLIKMDIKPGHRTKILKAAEKLNK